LGPINGLAGPHVKHRGANVHIRNGDPVARTDTTNELGNLLVGCNEHPGDTSPGVRGGSHNLIIGRLHRYSSYRGLVAGHGNFDFSSVSGGVGRSAVGNAEQREACSRTS